jgi:hypothetical protein
MATFKIEYINRSFGSNETIEAVIRNCNKDENITGGLLQLLMTNFNKENKYSVPMIGTEYKIPIIKRR